MDSAHSCSLSVLTGVGDAAVADAGGDDEDKDDDLLGLLCAAAAVTTDRSYGDVESE